MLKECGIIKLFGREINLVLGTDWFTAHRHLFFKQLFFLTIFLVVVVFNSPYSGKGLAHTATTNSIFYFLNVTFKYERFTF
jgi:hypothetical protein